MFEAIFDPSMVWLVLSLSVIYVFAFVMNQAKISRLSIEYLLDEQLQVATESKQCIPSSFIRQFLFVRRKRPCLQDHHSSDDEDGTSLRMF